MPAKSRTDINKERGHLVVKRNDLIQKSRHQLSLQEQKIMLYLISRIKPDDANFMEQVFTIQEFCRFCGMDETNGKNYSDIKDAIGKLLSRFIWVKQDDGSETSLRWIDKATINKFSGIIRLKLDEGLKPFLLLLTDHYTICEIRHILAMTSKYSIRLYELLRSYVYKGHVTFDIAELKRLLDAENYKLNGHFKVEVLDTALPEINKYTDITITYSFRKEGRRYSHVCFDVGRKETFDRFVAGHDVNQAIDSR